MTSKPPAVSPAKAKPRKSIKVQFWYDDGTMEWVEGKEYEKWQKGVNGAIQNDYIHGAWSQSILTSIKWEKSPTSRPAQDIVAEMREKVEALKSKTLMYHPTRMFTSNLEGSGYNIGHYDGIEDVLAVFDQFLDALTTSDSALSPTKNRAPTEAERD